MSSVDLGSHFPFMTTFLSTPTASFYDRLKDLRDANRIFVKPCIKPIIREFAWDLV